MPIVTQTWTHDLTCMQQTVLLTAVRGPDNVPKYHPSKFLLRFYRRCVLVSSLDHRVITTPYEKGGGSFMGPSYTEDLEAPFDWRERMEYVFHNYLRTLDELPHHYQLHFMHAAEIVGYKHPDKEIRSWWRWVYLQLVDDMHLLPETEEMLDFRLGDSEEQWRATSSKATQE